MECAGGGRWGAACGRSWDAGGGGGGAGGGADRVTSARRAGALLLLEVLFLFALHL